MLKTYSFTNSEVKESLLILAFSFLMREYLTVFTLGFVCLGCALVISKIRPSKKVRNSLALVIFASYWWSYGKVIDPEVGLNFLTTVTMLKLLEKETLRDRFMVFFGLLLIISAGSLFEKTLSYVFYFGISFFVLIQDFYQNIGARWRIGELLKAIVWVFPLTAFLFFLAPRSMSPIPFQQGTPTQGQIGYTSNVNISQMESLSGNDKPVFEVKLSQKISQDRLYWRGNSINFTDGWNWLVLSKTYPKHIEGMSELPARAGIRQNFRSISREDYYFSLDHPQYVASRNRVFNMETSRSFPQGRSEWSPRYEVLSNPYPSYASTENLQTYVRNPLRRHQKEWIAQTFPGETPDEILSQVKAYFVAQNFTYSLSPGKIETFQDFMLTRKTGFCSHYASAVALILRVKKIPSRLVSGFMGGTHNSYADFYEVSQNDAHVWIEYVQDGMWKKVDPTGWIAPERLALGGEAFMVSQSSARTLSFLNRFGWYYDMRMWLGQWDFVFYQWLEEMDYQFQEKWIRKFNLKRQWMYTFAILSVVIFMLLYMWSLSRERGRRYSSSDEELWNLYLQKLEARGLRFLPVSLSEGRSHLSGFKHEDSQILLKIWDDLVDLSFSTRAKKNEKQILSEIKRL
jgi:protein-glutamine gamma-glutamyltransferase